MIHSEISLMDSIMDDGTYILWRTTVGASSENVQDQCIGGNHRNEDSVTKWKKINVPNATYV